ncbi:hypothetical protein [Phenylobacterium sp.]|uniref:hypothetical protein n=1 Tax=Phenylobacterium sp. TaxID=1871053 RepID=UPI002737AC7A|nr:hypothetical protein [Phenylobacterium sp.]MDP3866722.1 hypothetical protein [Phenylobacterium sp.]
MAENRTPQDQSATPQQPAPSQQQRQDETTNTNGGEQSKTGTGLGTGVETGAIEPGNSHGANNAR